MLHSGKSRTLTRYRGSGMMPTRRFQRTAQLQPDPSIGSQAGFNEPGGDRRHLNRAISRDLSRGRRVVGLQLFVIDAEHLFEKVRILQAPLGGIVGLAEPASGGDFQLLPIDGGNGGYKPFRKGKKFPVQGIYLAKRARGQLQQHRRVWSPSSGGSGG
jgi:hypothetical protein